MNNEFKTNARSNYICKFEVSDWFRQSSLFRDVFFLFLSSYFSLMMEFIVLRNLVSRKHYHFYSKRLILLY